MNSQRGRTFFEKMIYLTRVHDYILRREQLQRSNKPVYVLLLLLLLSLLFLLLLGPSATQTS